MIAATLLCGSGAASVAAAGDKPARGVQADGTTCAFSVAKSATPAARCAAIRRQCGGKFYANACGDRLLSASEQADRIPETSVKTRKPGSEQIKNTLASL